MAAKKPTEPKATEEELLDLLERMHAKQGNGGSGEYAFLRQVRNAASFNATRTFDALAFGLWPSRGHTIHIFEVKVSRGDWKRELADPKKADDAAAIADRFSIVATRGVVDPAELPPMWGLIEAYGGTEITEPREPLWPGQPPSTVTRVEGRRLRTVKAAPLLRPADKCSAPISRSLLVCLLRAAGATPDTQAPADRVIQAAVAEAVAKCHADRDAREADTRAVRAQDDAVAAAFWRASWLSIRHSNVADATELGNRVRAAMRAQQEPQWGIDLLRRTADELTRLAGSLTSRAESSREAADALTAAEDTKNGIPA